jgi:hypothetical protein
MSIFTWHLDAIATVDGAHELTARVLSSETTLPSSWNALSSSVRLCAVSTGLSGLHGCYASLIYVAMCVAPLTASHKRHSCIHFCTASMMSCCTEGGVWARGGIRRRRAYLVSHQVQ